MDARLITPFFLAINFFRSFKGSQSRSRGSSTMDVWIPCDAPYGRQFSGSTSLSVESTSIGDGFIPACGSHILTSSISLLSASSGGAMRDGLELGAADRSCGCCFLNFFFCGHPQGRFCCCIRVGMVCVLVSVWVKGISVLQTCFTCHFCFSLRFCSNLIIVTSNLPHGEL